ncbi:transcription-repair coupling factor [Verrucomicrobium spinosum]|uniref:transcription-repair coupling factor n=1 Tax=Verrucomicrobium spinosum TaxID=2736 RepID=UPI0001745840|nr:transcription-repair coupling factor [Verrucomicrobium spinosum]
MAKEKELHVDEHHLAESLVKVAHGAKPFGTVWKALKSGGIILDHVAKEAWPFATALAAQALPKRRLWVVCPDARVQEQVQGELRVWGLPALFFPRLSQMGDAAGLPDPDALAERITALTRFSESMAGKGHGKGKARPGDSGEATGGDEGQPRVLVICADSLDEEVPALHELEAGKMSLQTGMKLDVEALLQDLGSAGYERVPVVTERGQVARRGGIVDVFSWQAEEPLRMEFFDDELESLRSFDIHTQTSVQRFQRMQLLLHSADTTGETTTVRQFIQEQDAVIALEVETLSPATVTITSGARADLAEEDFSTAIFENPLGVFHAGDFVVQEARREQFTRQVEDWRKQKWRVVMFFHNPGERERFEELVGGEWLQKHDLELALGLLHRGFVIPAAKLAVLTGAEVFGRYQNTRRFRGSKLDEAQVLRQARDHLRELREGDLVVHLDYGIGKYGGIEVREGARREEVMVIRYAEDAKVFVPVSQAHLVSRYVGVGSRAPTLNKLGDARWVKTRAQAEKSVEEFAAGMLSIAAQRQTLKGHAHPPDTKWQVEFEQSFLYRETPDQLKSIAEIKRDMEQEKPMDRLLCGDVGFGKTEVAIRAAFKAVMGGKQVAVLVPTTVLAQQHLATFKERMSDYPVTVEMLSRLTPAKREKEILKGVKDGTVDIVVGTHRVISKDVQFKQLGLAVIDEEQRFGVKHKERFKQLFRLVDVLTLSATPIPRTLYLGLVGMRDMSTLDTPPPNRHAVQTSVCGYDERIIRDAINKEIERGGQVFFLHNRVMDMEKMKAKLEALSPKARVVIGHGQMDETLLEDVMRRFIAGEADVLLCTTIIESGVDIPNANTIIIDRADRFGLADLYQLRGRVGRGGERAHAYLMLPRDLMTVGDARKRVTAIKQYTALGSGFKIAMRDLEIRGAGNLLGTEQSGHIFAIGFDLYCQMLKSATARLQGRRTPPPMEVSLRVDFLCMSEAQWLQEADGTPQKRVTAATAHRPPDRQKLVTANEWRIPCFIPQSYIEDARSRITAYRLLGEVLTRKELDTLERNWRDQYGPPPPAVENLLVCAGIKLAAAHASISAVEVKEGKLMLTRNGQYVLLSGKFPRLTANDPTLQLRESFHLLRSF